MNIFIEKIAPIAQVKPTVGTAIMSLIEPMSARRAVIMRATFANLATAQTLTVMQVLGVTTASADAAASQKVVNISADPGSIAANDYCVIKLTNGHYQVNKVASVSTLAITFTDNLEGAVASGNAIYFMGVVGDGHAQYAIAASEETEFSSDVGAFVGKAKNYPMILSCTNATNQCTLQGGVVAYVDA